MNHRRRVSDEELTLFVRVAIHNGENHTELLHRLVGAAVACDLHRLRRLWVREGGRVREQWRLYASGTGPMDWRP